MLALQRTAGNRAVCELLRCKDKKKKRQTPGQIRAAQMAEKSAPKQSQYQFANLPLDVRNAIQDILAGNEANYLRPNQGKHSTDPETGMPKGQGIGVREYHTVPYSESKRIVTRSERGVKTVYYDPSHVAGTYTYHRVNGAPFPAPAPAAGAGRGPSGGPRRRPGRGTAARRGPGGRSGGRGGGRPAARELVGRRRSGSV